MKKLLLLNILLATLVTPMQAAAAQIQAFAINANVTYGNFSATPDGSTLSNTEIESNIIDPYTPLYSTNPETDPLLDYSVIDLDFGDTTVITGSGGDTQGADLVVVSLWSGYDYKFGLEAFDINGLSLSSYSYDVTLDLENDTCLVYSGDNCDIYLATTAITLLNNNLKLEPEDRVLIDDIELGHISLSIGGGLYNGNVGDGGSDAYSNFTYVGAFHTDSAVVPLPLPAVLFSSGLLLLGWVGRRKKHS